MLTVAIPALACLRWASVSAPPSKVRLTPAPLWPLNLALPPELPALLKVVQLPLKLTAGSEARRVAEPGVGGGGGGGGATAATVKASKSTHGPDEAAFLLPEPVTGTVCIPAARRSG